MAEPIDLTDTEPLPGDPVLPDALPTYYDLRTAARAVGMSTLSIRMACRSYLASIGVWTLSKSDLRRPVAPLKCFIPRGKLPNHCGMGHGYQIARRDLQDWYFGNH